MLWKNIKSVVTPGVPYYHENVIVTIFFLYILLILPIFLEEKFIITFFLYIKVMMSQFVWTCPLAFSNYGIYACILCLSLSLSLVCYSFMKKCSCVTSVRVIVHEGILFYTLKLFYH